MGAQRLFGGITLLVLAGLGPWTPAASAQGVGARPASLDSLATVRGHVTARATGLPLVGASVTLALPDTTVTVETGDSGMFTLADVPPGTHPITARAVGYQSLTRSVVVQGASVEVTFALEQPIVRLNELVATAAGPQRRRDLGNAITTLPVDSLLQYTPFETVTELLATRVPGLTTQPTSGAPGDPARLRLRGLGSVLRSNDPVVVVDGIRVYAAQSDARSGNLTNLDPAAAAVDSTGRSLRIYPFDVPAPSPLDQIDPNSIEKIEVFNGPSASTLYGQDAANGVIVITTKRGTPGPTRWNASITQGRTTIPHDYPVGYYRWGTSAGTPQLCPLFTAPCVQDSLVRFQALNDEALTVFGTGRRTGLSLAASGGTSTLSYHVTGTYGNETGPLTLPTREVDHFRTAFNRDPDEWMQRPQQLQTWSVTSRIGANLGRTAALTLSTRLARSEQHRSSLEQQVPVLMGTYAEADRDVFYRPSATTAYTMDAVSSLIDHYYIQQSASTVTFTNAVALDWRPRPWVTARGNAGLDLVSRDDQLLLPAGLASATDSGARIRGNGRSLVGSFDLQGEVRRSLGRSYTFSTSAGANLTTTRTDDLVNSAIQLVPGTTSLTGARQIYGTDFSTNMSVYGVWIEPRLAGKRLAFSAGLRLDGGSTYGPAEGTGLGGLVRLPTLNASWVLSDEPWFPQALKPFVSSLRLRGAYGQAEVQPGATDRLRLYADTGTAAGSQLTLIATGNTQLRPERSREVEGGFDADLLGRMASLEVTAYRKTQVDALMPVQLPPSVLVDGVVLENVGQVRNTGLEVSLGVTPLSWPAWAPG